MQTDRPPVDPPILFVIAGPNGVGKTTIFSELIPAGLKYINADSISRQIRTKHPNITNSQELANQEAVDIFNYYVASRESFSIETNLKDQETYKTFEVVQAKGYQVYIYFLCVETATVCNERIKHRVLEGGHYVRPDIVVERY